MALVSVGQITLRGGERLIVEQAAPGDWRVLLVHDNGAKTMKGSAPSNTEAHELRRKMLGLPAKKRKKGR
jgi:hypothetical protein